MEPKKILVAEDEDSLRRVLLERLQQEGFSPIEAADGQLALELALLHKPDLILLDIRMPKLDGFSVLKRLRESDGYGKEARVIILTNLNPDDANVVEAIDQYEPAFYLIKVDYSLSDIVEKVREVLAQ